MRDDLYFVSITCLYGYAGHDEMGWNAKINWQDSKFAESGAVEGVIRTRYFEPTLTQAINAILEVAEQWELKTLPTLPPALYYEGDSENKDFPPPENWKAVLKKEAELRGWETYPEEGKEE